jgi:hypothetical protein
VKALFILLLMPISAFAQDLFSPLSPYDVIGQVGVQVMLLRDYKQTEQIVEDSYDWHETNPLLGPHPSQHAINRYFVGYSIASGIATWAMPSRFRPWWQGGQIAVEIVVTQRNRSIGIKGAF